MNKRLSFNLDVLVSFTYLVSSPSPSLAPRFFRSIIGPSFPLQALINFNHFSLCKLSKISFGTHDMELVFHTFFVFKLGFARFGGRIFRVKSRVLVSSSFFTVSFLAFQVPANEYDLKKQMNTFQIFAEKNFQSF